MTKPYEPTLQQFREDNRKIKSYQEALGVLYWDLRTGAPRKAVEGRSAVIGMLSGEMFRLSTSDRMGEQLDALSEPGVFEQLDITDRRLVEESKREYDRSRKIPQDKYEAYVVLTSQAESVWEDAKDNGDWDSFRPYLEQIVAANREFIELWGYEGHPYNTLLDMYEPGMTVQQLDRVFGELRDKTVPLLKQIQEVQDRVDYSFLFQPCDIDKQRAFSEFMLKEMGFDFAAGRLDKSVHPFASGLNPGDVRVTTNYRANDFTFSLFSTIHEGGHALYEQNISPDLMGTTLCTGTSMGIHESQSRLWENKIGRGLSFWTRYYADLQQAFPGMFGGVELERFYRAINKAQPSLIRIEADELTYNLHIMIRYELEKALFDGSLAVADLPQAWNDKYMEYLGIKAERMSDGVLQDVHWAGGSFGYFPSYALGNMYAAQILHTMKQAIPDLDGCIARGELKVLKDWLSERIYRFGMLKTPSDVIRDVTGEELNPTYLADYLETKFKDVYRL